MEQHYFIVFYKDSRRGIGKTESENVALSYLMSDNEIYDYQSFYDDEYDVLPHPVLNSKPSDYEIHKFLKSMDKQELLH